MLSRLHNKLGTAGLVVAIVALVAALTGAAFAAVPGLNSKQKKQVTKIAKKYAGKPGAPGAAGPAGAKGDKGDKGDAGTNGTNGKDGTNGTNGTNGKSVVVGTPTEAECADGGATVQVEGTPASKKAICNGETGFTETLPAGETETGVWSLLSEGAGSRIAEWSFPIPLAAVPTFNWIDTEGEAIRGNLENCDGNAAEPAADPGNLCVYAANEDEGFVPGEFNPFVFFEDETGFLANVTMSGSGGAVFGTWAVTEEVAP